MIFQFELWKLIQLKNLKKTNMINIDSWIEFTFMLELNWSNYFDHNFFIKDKWSLRYHLRSERFLYSRWIQNGPNLKNMGMSEMEEPNFKRIHACDMLEECRFSPMVTKASETISPLVSLMLTIEIIHRVQSSKRTILYKVVPVRIC